MNSQSLVFTSNAEYDLISSYNWYEDKQVGLGEKFYTALDDCFDSIRVNYTSYSIKYKTYRQAPVKGFPFVVFYEFLNDVVLIVAVFHTSLNPSKKPK